MLPESSKINNKLGFIGIVGLFANGIVAKSRGAATAFGHKILLKLNVNTDT